MPVAANNLAWMYAESGENLDRALQLAQAATRRLPKSPAVQDTLGWVYYEKGAGDYGDRAVSAEHRARPEEPGSPLPPWPGASQNGDSPKARIALSRALALAPDFEGAAEAKQALASLKSSER